MDIKFIKREELQEKPDQKKLGFGKYFADYMFTMDYDEGIGWHDATIRPYGPIEMNPATVVLHYAQETFEISLCMMQRKQDLKKLFSLLKKKMKKILKKP